VRQVLDIISSGDTEAADEILGSNLEITVAIINGRNLILGPAEVVVAGDGCSAVELAEALLGLRLSGRIEAVPSEEFIGGDTLLGTETGPGLSEFFVYI
jgi:hypothetical protein